MGDDIAAALKLAETTWRPKFDAWEAVAAAERKQKERDAAKQKRCGWRVWCGSGWVGSGWVGLDWVGLWAPWGKQSVVEWCVCLVGEPEAGSACDVSLSIGVGVGQLTPGRR